MAKELALPMFHITSCVKMISPTAEGWAFFTLIWQANSTSSTPHSAA